MAQATPVSDDAPAAEAPGARPGEREAPLRVGGAAAAGTVGTGRGRVASAALARSAFADHPIYQVSLGLDAAGFDSLWRSFLSMAVDDPGARVWGALHGGEIVGVLVIAPPEFPSTVRGLRFIGGLLWSVGMRPVLRYLRLYASYARIMRRPAKERRIEVQGIWLAASATRSPVRVGRALALHGMREAAREGRTLVTGVVDARNLPLVSYYRRLGFTVGEPVAVPGGLHARMERRMEVPGVASPEDGGGAA